MKKLLPKRMVLDIYSCRDCYWHRPNAEPINGEPQHSFPYEDISEFWIAYCHHPNFTNPKIHPNRDNPRWIPAFCPLPNSPSGIQKLELRSPHDKVV